MLENGYDAHAGNPGHRMDQKYHRNLGTPDIKGILDPEVDDMLPHRKICSAEGAQGFQGTVEGRSPVVANDRSAVIGTVGHEGDLPGLDPGIRGDLDDVRDRDPVHLEAQGDLFTPYIVLVPYLEVDHVGPVGEGRQLKGHCCAEYPGYEIGSPGIILDGSFMVRSVPRECHHLSLVHGIGCDADDVRDGDPVDGDGIGRLIAPESLVIACLEVDRVGTIGQHVRTEGLIGAEYPKPGSTPLIFDKIHVIMGAPVEPHRTSLVDQFGHDPVDTGSGIPVDGDTGVRLLAPESLVVLHPEGDDVGTVGEIRYPKILRTAEVAVPVRSPCILHNAPVVMYAPIEVHPVPIGGFGGIEGIDECLGYPVDVQREGDPLAPEVVVVPDPEIYDMGPVPQGGT